MRGVGSRMEKGLAVKTADGAAMILGNPKIFGENVVPDPHFLPATNIGYTDTLIIHNYINSSSNPTAIVTPGRTQLGVRPSPTMAAFSSIGPNPVEPNIIKVYKHIVISALITYMALFRRVREGEGDRERRGRGSQW